MKKQDADVLDGLRQMFDGHAWLPGAHLNTYVSSLRDGPSSLTPGARTAMSDVFQLSIVRRPPRGSRYVLCRGMNAEGAAEA